MNEQRRKTPLEIFNEVIAAADSQFEKVKYAQKAAFPPIDPKALREGLIKNAGGGYAPNHQSVSAYGETITHVDPITALFAQIGAMKAADDLASYMDELSLSESDLGVTVRCVALVVDLQDEALGRLIAAARSAL